MAGPEGHTGADRGHAASGGHGPRDLLFALIFALQLFALIFALQLDGYRSEEVTTAAWIGGVTFAVVWPVVPSPTRCWSTTPTDRPSHASKSAAVIPVMPAR